MPLEIQIVIHEGEIRFIHQDDLAEVFQAGKTTPAGPAMSSRGKADGTPTSGRSTALCWDHSIAGIPPSKPRTTGFVNI